MIPLGLCSAVFAKIIVAMEQEIADYINKQSSPQKEICLALRKTLLDVFPEIKEEMKWGAMVFGEGRYYIGVVKYGVNFGFAINGLSNEEVKFFDGNGKTMRHLKFEELDTIDDEKLIKLIRLVHEKALCDPC
jgi:hypothetical protein